MLSTLFDLIPGGGLTALFGALMVALAGVFAVFTTGRRAGRDKERAQNADALDKHYQDIAAAGRARSDVPSKLPDNDPYRRD